MKPTKNLKAAEQFVVVLDSGWLVERRGNGCESTKLLGGLYWAV